MAKIGIIHEDDGTSTVRLEAPYFLHCMSFLKPDGSDGDKIANDMARAIACGMAIGFDAGVLSERADPGETEFIDRARNDLSVHIPESKADRAALQARQKAGHEERDHQRVFEWFTPSEGFTPTFMPGAAQTPKAQ